MLAWMEGFEAVRPNAFHSDKANRFPQLVVSAIADNPTTSHLAGPPPPLGADILVSDCPLLVDHEL